MSDLTLDAASALAECSERWLKACCAAESDRAGGVCVLVVDGVRKRARLSTSPAIAAASGAPAWVSICRGRTACGGAPRRSNAAAPSRPRAPASLLGDAAARRRNSRRGAGSGITVVQLAFTRRPARTARIGPSYRRSMLLRIDVRELRLAGCLSGRSPSLRLREHASVLHAAS